MVLAEVLVEVEVEVEVEVVVKVEVVVVATDVVVVEPAIVVVVSAGPIAPQPYTIEIATMNRTITPTPITNRELYLRIADPPYSLIC